MLFLLSALLMIALCECNFSLISFLSLSVYWLLPHSYVCLMVTFLAVWYFKKSCSLVGKQVVSVSASSARLVTQYNSNWYSGKMKVKVTKVKNQLLPDTYLPAHLPVSVWCKVNFFMKFRAPSGRYLLSAPSPPYFFFVSWMSFLEDTYRESWWNDSLVSGGWCNLHWNTVTTHFYAG